jgi:hypothetical protein
MKRWLAALAVGFCVAALAYSASRALQVWLFVEPDPRTVIAPARIAFFWRAWIALYAGLLAMLGAAALRPETIDARIGQLVMLTAVATALQGLLLP